MVMLCFKVLLNILFGGWIEICLLVLLYDIYVLMEMIILLNFLYNLINILNFDCIFKKYYD